MCLRHPFMCPRDPLMVRTPPAPLESSVADSIDMREIQLSRRDLSLDTVQGVAVQVPCVWHRAEGRTGDRRDPRPLPHHRAHRRRGEVYRATDTKLKRDVAIKVLPDEVAQDPARLARFQREAELLASLNHPNIVAIHGLEEAEGKPLLVLELVEGD